jgi:hypothetical protein
MDNYTIKIAKGLANNADARLIRQQVFVEEQGFVNLTISTLRLIMLLSTQEDIPLQQAGCLTKMVKRTLDVSA